MSEITKSVVLAVRPGSPLARCVVADHHGNVSMPLGGGRTVISGKDFDLLGSAVVEALKTRKPHLAADMLDNPMSAIGMIRQAQIEML